MFVACEHVCSIAFVNSQHGHWK